MKNATSIKNTGPSILDAIKGSEQEEAAKLALVPTETPTNEEGDEAPKEEGVKDPDGNEPSDEAPAPSMWGKFAIEVGIAPPSRSEANTKYDWASFPAPSDPKDSKTWPSIFIPKIGSKSISGSIKSFRDKLQEAGKTAPEFTISVVKDAAKEHLGVRVFRKS